MILRAAHGLAVLTCRHLAFVAIRARLVRAGVFRTPLFAVCLLVVAGQPIRLLWAAHGLASVARRDVALFVRPTRALAGVVGTSMIAERQVHIALERRMLVIGAASGVAASAVVALARHPQQLALPRDFLAPVMLVVALVFQRIEPVRAP